MSQYIMKKCQECGASLRVSSRDAEVSCRSCGAEYEVLVHGAKSPGFSRRLVHAQALKTYEVLLEPKDLISPVFGGSVSSYGGANVTWKEPETTVHTAWTKFIAHSVNPGSYITPLSIEARILMNGVLIDTEGWYVTPGCESKSSESGSVPVINGRNEFVVEMVPTFHPFAAGLDGVHLSLYVQYTGEPPTVTKPPPPPPPWFEAIWPYLKWGLVGVGAVGATLVVIELVKKRS